MKSDRGNLKCGASGFRSDRAHRRALRYRVGGSTPEIRRSIRQARVRPLFDSMRTYMEDTLAKLSRKSDTASATRYASSSWQALTRYVDDGQLEIDNKGGKRAAAKLNGLDPELYLHQGLKRIADRPISQITELLPWKLAVAKP
jgi:transposase